MIGEGAAVPVFTSLPAYRAAAAELPLSTRLTTTVGGSVAVVPGAGEWWKEAAEARRQSAAAIVVVDPVEAPASAVEMLHQRCKGIPVIVERPRLRSDVVADARAGRAGIPARVVMVECASLDSEFEAVVRDAIGWARVFDGGSLRVRSVSATPRSRMGLLESASAAGALPIALSATTLAGREEGGLVRVLVLAEVLSSVTVDVPAGLMCVENSTSEGTLRMSTRFEASARLSLRRALEALASGEALADLEELLHDSRLAAAFSRPIQGDGLE
ncbi:hypothetical protein [Arthrobacter ramosus]|uniref:Uncharacterized protein n=1 Tax=Arthrobacter ramosus TaxID=1672 RepID=A0ABV5XXH3_ARTRM|nr:hypothetical protein [Arthrobacter ramosus]